jgi:hypothetical protein
MRRSTRLASLSTAGKPGDRARSVKLKKWGIQEEDEDATTVKKKQLLSTYHGAQRQIAEEAINDLLGIEARCA